MLALLSAPLALLAALVVIVIVVAVEELGATSSAVRCTMESFTGDSLLEVCSDFSTTLLKDSATLLAMSESCFATGSHLL